MDKELLGSLWAEDKKLFGSLWAEGCGQWVCDQDMAADKWYDLRVLSQDWNSSTSLSIT